jgi:hypothetical protein
VAEKSVIAYLLADTPTAAQVGTRVYPVARPQGSSLPAVVVQCVTRLPVYADDGESGQTQMRITVTCYGVTYAQAKDLAVLVRSRLSAVRDVTQGTVTFRYIMLLLEQDLRELGSDEAEYQYKVIQDYTIWFE